MIERKRYRTASLAVAVGIGIAGCSNSEDGGAAPPQSIEVTNISKYNIEMSNNPRMYTPARRTGTIEAGQKALALCLTAWSDTPERTGLRVRRGDDVGYIHLYSAGTKDTDGAQQLEPGFDQLKQLPLCHPPVGARVEKRVNVRTADGQIDLEAGTLVTAECVSGGPFNLQAKINNGPHAGQTADGLPRDALEATTDPYKASQQHPPQDPFGPLPPCSEL